MLLPMENLEGPGGVSRFPEALRRELQILSFAEWRSPRPAFDPEKHVIQVVGVGHVLEAAEVALIEPHELDAVDHWFVAGAQRLAARRREVSAEPRCPMVVLVKDADEVGEQMFRPTLCGRCEGCRLLVPTTAAAEVEAATTGATVSTRSTLYDPGLERLENILPRLPEVSGATSARPAAVVAPFFSLKALVGGADMVLLANNYTSQGLKLKRVRRILDAVYCRLLHLGPGAIEDCAFLAMRDGIAVLDLGMIPEKYRLDPERAERILERGLGLWLETLDDALGERRAS
jgi:ATP-dependent Lon protease